MRSSFALPLVALSGIAHATIVPFKTVYTRSNKITKRAGVISVKNNYNAQYVANITLSGVDIPVMLDSGSSDLWVAVGTLPQAKDTGKAVTLNYAVGAANGDINTASLKFSDYEVTDQAFLQVLDTSTFTKDFATAGYKGLVGFGPNSGSLIAKAMKTGGETMMDRIFMQNKTSSNYVSFLLDRYQDGTDAFPGQMSISEIVPGFENVTSQPKLPVELVHKIVDQDQHWQVRTSLNGIIGPDGVHIPLNGIKADEGVLVAVIDTGFTFSQVPRSVADAIYGRVQGAIYDLESEIWTVPCDQWMNITLVFGEKSFPQHPNDVVSDDFNEKDANGNKICIGAWQPITSAFSLLGEFDMILGMAFMRNAYTVLDYGKFVKGSSKDQGNPFVQMVALTNALAAKNDFIATRLKGTDNTNDAGKALLPADQAKNSPISDAEKRKKYEQQVLSRWPYILLGCLAFVTIVTGLVIWKCCCKRGKKNAVDKAFLPGGGASYVPLQAQGRNSGGGHAGGYTGHNDNSQQGYSGR